WFPAGVVAGVGFIGLPILLATNAENIAVIQRVFKALLENAAVCGLLRLLPEFDFLPRFTLQLLALSGLYLCCICG
ncbi:hypothetical protein GGX14DRAFT_483833, partial [Mycena pura]